mmetsp:Transcript_1737/g.6093  ORF Transcript_1737/g.6093 Transcript_1737/m.6093 type:complete len:384 (-) Transcript_1737:2348-3499(-)
MKSELYSSVITLDQTNFETHLRVAYNSKLPALNPLLAPSPQNQLAHDALSSPHTTTTSNGRDSSRRKSQSSASLLHQHTGGSSPQTGGASPKHSSRQSSKLPSLQWDLHIRNTFFPTHTFYIKISKPQFKLITKHYGPQFKQKKLLSIVRQALDPEYTRASFGYFFTDGSVDVKLGDDIVDKLRGKSRRRPLSTTDILILKIMFQGGDDSAALSPRSSQNNHPDLVFWLVLHQRRATAPFHNYKLIRELERQVNLCKAENNELRHYMHQMHSEMLQMRMDMRLLRENACAPPYTSAYTTFGGATSPMPPPNNASTWLPWKNPRYAFNPDSAQPPSSQLVVSTIPASVQLNNSTQKSPSASQNHSPRTSSTAYRTTHHYHRHIH